MIFGDWPEILSLSVFRICAWSFFFWLIQRQQIARSSAQASTEGLRVELSHVPRKQRFESQLNRHIVERCENRLDPWISHCRGAEITAVDAAVELFRAIAREQLRDTGSREATLGAGLTHVHHQ